MNMNDEQQAAFDKIIKWFRSEPQKQCLTLGGYAGVGKTYLVSRLVGEGFAIIKVLTPTGKAAQVLRKKGVPADTIHSFIYNYEGEDEETHEMIFSRKETHARPQLLIVDESSMVPLPIYNDLLQTGLRILWVGDHGQLEPVGEDAGLMRNPEIRLETIMRQAAESPILSLAHTTRTGGLPTLGTDPRLTVDFIRGIDSGRASADYLLSFDQILVAFNKTRVFLNMQIRAAQQRKALIEPGEKLICLMNNRRKGLFNGMLVNVLEVRKDYGESIECRLETDDGRMPVVDVWKGHFNKDRRVSEPPRGLGIFDYGYAITCHKSQGSEFPSVLVVEEPSERWSMARWRYTAITRAAERLVYRSDEVLEPLGQEAQPGLFEAAPVEPTRFASLSTPAEVAVARTLRVSPSVVTVKPGAGRYDGFFSFASGGAAR